MPLLKTLADVHGGPEDVASFLLSRDAVYIDGQRGFVNSTMRVIDNVVGGGGAFEWGFLSILNNEKGHGENVAGYFQANNSQPGGTIWGQVVEARNNEPSAISVVQELDAVGHTAVITDAIAFGHTEIGMRIEPAIGGSISTALAVNADVVIVDQNPTDHFIYLNPVQDAGIALVGGHFLFTEQGHVAAVV